jgi:hypothetical protein
MSKLRPCEGRSITDFDDAERPIPLFSQIQDISLSDYYPVLILHPNTPFLSFETKTHVFDKNRRREAIRSRYLGLTKGGQLRRSEVMQQIDQSHKQGI